MKKRTCLFQLMAACFVVMQLLLSACIGSYPVQSSDSDSGDTAAKEPPTENPVTEPPSQPPVASGKTTLSQEEWKLYRLMMDYRKSKGLAQIPLSNALSVVAQAHCKDLQDNPSIVNTNCNMHSWSNKGKWSACCYTSDHAQADCMWKKPREMTSYKGNGYEISHGVFRASVTAEGALKGWQSSPSHEDVILNRGMWKNKWNAVGMGISQGFAMVWFGNEVDQEGSPILPQTR